MDGERRLREESEARSFRHGEKKKKENEILEREHRVDHGGEEIAPLPRFRVSNLKIRFPSADRITVRKRKRTVGRMGSCAK